VSPRAGARALRAALGALLLLVPAAGGALGPHPTACRTLADFAGGRPGDFPAGWDARDAAARATYRVQAESDLRFLRGIADGTGSQIARDVDWNLATHPLLHWRWRPHVFPAGADERDPARNDSALAVYAVFGAMPVAGALRAVKYVWSARVPAGTVIPNGRARVVVLRSGAAHDGEWTEETVDVRRDFERLFGEPPPRVRGLALLTDADQTHARAVGDYGPLEACRAADP